MSNFKTRVLVEIALTIALSTVLGMFKLFQMPNGGEISLAMLPLFVLAIRRGPVVGVVAGALYGGVDLMTNPVIYYPLQVVLDYPVAYGAVGLAGVLRPVWSRLAEEGRAARGVFLAVLPGVLIGATGRYAAHVLSGYVFFGEYAPEGQPVIVYSMLYNSYVYLSAAACYAAAAVVTPALERITGAGEGRVA